MSSPDHTPTPGRAAYPFAHRLRVRYAEVDAQAVVYNAHYLTYFDIALLEHLRWLGFEDPARPRPDDFFVKRCTLEYESPLRLDELFDVAVRTARLGRSSITFELAVFRAPRAGAAPARCAHGEVVWVYTNLSRMRSTPLPADLRARFEAGTSQRPS